ncbi:MAG: glycosyltransferase family 2 protein [Bacteroidales bacterium]|nr:glycosyltransferase family 2 protein [Bacteroidales bacterium]
MAINFGVLKNIVRPIYYWFFTRYYYLLEVLFPSKIKDPKEIPIIINNFNRFTYLKILIEALEQRNYLNIYIIDNASTYPPLLEFYNKCPYHIFRLGKNMGPFALWQSDIYKKFINDFYVYTDSDVVPVKECPDDFMEIFLKVLRKHKFARKVGFSLRIDNIPDQYDFKNEVLHWEKQFFGHTVDDILFKAPIDTTFALYRPRARDGANSYVTMFRTKFPYEAEHLPWYVNSRNMSEEDIFYIRNARTTSTWTELSKKNLE